MLVGSGGASGVGCPPAAGSGGLARQPLPEQVRWSSAASSMSGDTHHETTLLRGETLNCGVGSRRSARMTPDGNALLTPAASTATDDVDRRPVRAPAGARCRHDLRRAHLLRCGELNPARTGRQRPRQGGCDRGHARIAPIGKTRSAGPTGSTGSLALLLPVMWNVSQLTGGAPLTPDRPRRRREGRLRTPLGVPSGSRFRSLEITHAGWPFPRPLDHHSRHRASDPWAGQAAGDRGRARSGRPELSSRHER